MLTLWQSPACENSPPEVEHALAPDVVLVQVPDGTARLLDMAGGFYALPPIAFQMLRGVLERGIGATVQDLAHQYQMPAQTVNADLSGLLEQLCRQGALCHGPMAPQARTWWPALVL